MRGEQFLYTTIIKTQALRRKNDKGIPIFFVKIVTVYYHYTS